jgi:hypothetical protein
MPRTARNRFTIEFLPSETTLSCGCDACHEPDGSPGSPGGVTGFEAVMDDMRPRVNGRRVMRVYKSGIVRHARCGKISKPVI